MLGPTQHLGTIDWFSRLMDTKKQTPRHKSKAYTYIEVTKLPKILRSLFNLFETEIAELWKNLSIFFESTNNADHILEMLELKELDNANM